MLNAKIFNTVQQLLTVQDFWFSHMWKYSCLYECTGNYTCTISGNSWASAGPTPWARPSTCRTTDYNAFQPWCGHPKSPTCALAKYGTASGLVHPQPKPGPRFTVLLSPGWGAKGGKIFSPVVAGGTWTYELKIHSQVTIGQPLGQTHTHTHTHTHTQLDCWLFFRDLHMSLVINWSLILVKFL